MICKPLCVRMQHSMCMLRHYLISKKMESRISCRCINHATSLHACPSVLHGACFACKRSNGRCCAVRCIL